MKNNIFARILNNLPALLFWLGVLKEVVDFLVKKYNEYYNQEDEKSDLRGYQAPRD